MLSHTLRTWITDKTRLLISAYSVTTTPTLLYLSRYWRPVETLSKANLHFHLDARGGDCEEVLLTAVHDSNQLYNGEPPMVL